jgi:hypothetical protein
VLCSKVLDLLYQAWSQQGSIPKIVIDDVRAINIYTYSNTKRLLEHNIPTASLTSITFAAGILAGVVTSTATNPIWVVKTRLQLDKSITGARRYNNSIDCARQIFRQEGLKGFSRGLSASYLGVSESTLQWVLYERLKRVLRTERKVPTTYREKLGQALGAGFFAKLIATVITYPHEVGLSICVVADCRLRGHGYGRLRVWWEIRRGNIMDYLEFLLRYGGRRG